MYLIAKHGTYLNELGDYHQTWLASQAQAKPFYDKAVAQSVADTLDAQLVPAKELN